MKKDVKLLAERLAKVRLFAGMSSEELAEVVGFLDSALAVRLPVLVA